MPDPVSPYDAAQQAVIAESNKLTAVVGPNGPLSGQESLETIRLSRATGIPESGLVDKQVRDLVRLHAQAGEVVDAHTLFAKDAPLGALMRSQSPGIARASDADDIAAQADMERAARYMSNARIRPDGVMETLDRDGAVTAAYRDPWKFKAAMRDARTVMENQDEMYRAFKEDTSISGWIAEVLSLGSENFRVGALNSVLSTGRALGMTSEETFNASAELSSAVAAYNDSFTDDLVRGAGGLFADAPLMFTGGWALSGLKAVASSAMAARTIGRWGVKGLLTAAATAPRAVAALEPLAVRAGGSVGKFAKSVAQSRFLDGAATAAALNLPLATRQLALNQDGVAHGLIEFGIEMAVPSLFGRTGVEKALSRTLGQVASESASLTGMKRFIRSYLGDAAMEATEEGITEAAHMMHQYLAGDPDALSFRRLAVAFALGGIAGGVFGAPGAIADGRMASAHAEAMRAIAPRVAQADHAIEQRQALSTVIDANSAALNAAPEIKDRILRSASSDKRLFIDREAVAKLAADNNVTPEEIVIALTGSATQWSGGAEAGLPVEYSVADLARATVKPYAHGIADGSSAEPGKPTFKEETEFAAGVPKLLEDLTKAEGAKQDEEARYAADSQEALDAIAHDVDLGMQAVGYDARTAARAAKLHSSLFQSVAQKSGIKLADLYAQVTKGKGLTIARGTSGRGAYDPDKAILRLSDAATPEDFIHESGHLFLEVLRAAARAGSADMQNMEAELVAALGVQSLDGLSVDKHEEFAESFVNYMKTGKSPTPGLVDVFRSFAAFIKALVLSVSNMNPRFNEKLVPVFNAMLTVESEVRVDELAFGIDPHSQDVMRSLGINEEALAALSKAAVAAREDAMASTVENVLNDEAQKELAARQPMLMANAEREVDGSASSKAMAFMATNPVNSDELATVVRAIAYDRAAKAGAKDPDAVADKQVKETLKSMGDLAVKDGASLSAIAEASKASGSQAPSPRVLVDAIMHARPRAEQVDAVYRQSVATEMATLLAQQSDKSRMRYREAFRQVRTEMLRTIMARIQGTDSVSRYEMEGLRRVAQRVIAGQKITDVNPQKYLGAAASARKQLTRMLTSNNRTMSAIQRVADLAHQEMLAMALFNEAVATKAMVAERAAKVNTYRSVAVQKRVFKAGGSAFVTTDAGEPVQFDGEAEAIASGRPYIMTDSPLAALNTLLYVGGFNVSKVSQPEVMRRMQYMSDRGTKLFSHEPVRTWRNLTVEQFLDDADMADHLVERAKSIAEMADERAEAAHVARVSGLIAASSKHNSASKKWFPKALRWVRDLHLTYREFMTSLDGGDSGPFYEAFVRPIRSIRAAIEYRWTKTSKEWSDMLSTYQASNKAWSGTKTFRVSMTNEQAGTIDIPIDQVPVILALMGSPSNVERLVKTVPLDVINQIMALCGEPEVKAAKEIQRIIGKTWPERQAVDRAIGVKTAPALATAPYKARKWDSATQAWVIDANGIEAPAGYMPAKYVRDEKAALPSVNEASPTMGILGALNNGSSKERSDGAPDRTMSLDISDYVSESQKNEFYIAAAPHARMLDKLLNDRDLRLEMARVLGDEAIPVIRQTLIDFFNRGVRAASESERQGGTLVRHLRSGASFGSMAFNTVTAITQVPGPLNAAIAIPGLKDFMGAAIANPGRSYDVASADPRMASRAFNLEVGEAVDALRDPKNGPAKVYNWVKKNGFFMTSFVQKGVDAIVYAAAFHQGIAKGLEEEKARDYAYDVVVRTQGSGHVEDQSALQKSALGQFLMVAYTYGATVFNMSYAAFARNGNTPAERGAAFMRMLAFVAIPGALTVLLKDLLKTDDEDKKKVDTYAESLALETLMGFTGSVAIVREMSGVFQGYSYSGPMALKSTMATGNALMKVAQGEFDEKLAKDTIAAAAFLGLPSTAIWRIIQTAVNDPSDVRGYISGLPQSSTRQ